MSDQPDIEAERPDFERNALSRGLSVDRNDTGSYLMAVTEYRWRGWKDRACIAAERERELQRQYDALRIDWVAAVYDQVQYETLLKQAHQSVCSIQCPSVWPTKEPRPHRDLCRKITEALKKGPGDER